MLLWVALWSPTAGTAQEFSEVVGATYRKAGNRSIVQMPTSECSNVTSTPIVVDDFIVLPLHDRALQCSEHGPYAESLIGYDLHDGKVYVLSQAGGTEATLTYSSARGRLYWPILEQGAVRVLEPGTFRGVGGASGISALADSAGTLLRGLFYFGTVNSPFPQCQDKPNRDCGALFGVNRKGKVKRRIDSSSGFRGWVTGGPTTDGRYLYVGTGSGLLGSSSNAALHGCSTVKLDRRLRVRAFDDPGDTGCRSSGRGGDDEDAVAGEPALGPNSVWVQYTNPNEAGDQVQVIRYDRRLNKRCSVGFPTVARRANAASYYQAPTVDAEDNAYVTFTLLEGDSGLRGVLYRISPQCTATKLASRAARALASPTLVDDTHVLFATKGRLEVIRASDGWRLERFRLGTDAQVLAAPIVYDSDVYVLAEDGTLTVIDTPAVIDYGTAYWPRFRHDNHGSARAR